MILEAENETRDFVTVYRKDFEPKRLSTVQKFVPSSEFNPPLNALNAPFHEHLNTSRENRELPPGEKREDVRSYLNKLRAKHKHLQKFLQAPNESTIMKERKKTFKTTYQRDFSADLDDHISHHPDLGPTQRTQRSGSESEGERVSVCLPEGWIVPETTYRGYKDPRVFIELGAPLPFKKAGKPKDNIEFHLDPMSGNSEYADVIGSVGDRILKEQLHGAPTPIDPLTSWHKAPVTVSPECEEILAARKTPFISSIF